MLIFIKVFDEIFDREDLEDDDPEIQNDPLMKIDLLVRND